MSSQPVFPRRAGLLAVCVVLAGGAGCSLQIGTGIEARDTWTRTYPVTAGVVLEVREVNGLVQVDAGDGDTIVVNATRIARAPTEDAAKAMLADFTIAETVAPDHVALDGTTQGASLGAGKSRRVDYHITVPRSAAVTIRSTNSEIRVAGIRGALHVETSNGDITGTDLGSGADVRTVNGSITLELAKLGDAGVRAKISNGRILVTVPADSKAAIDASVVNGDIRTDHLSIAAQEQTGRTLKGTIGGGGPDIRLDAVNGEVRIVGR
jgi:hypothetical protein